MIPSHYCADSRAAIPGVNTWWQAAGDGWLICDFARETWGSPIGMDEPGVDEPACDECQTGLVLREAGVVTDDLRTAWLKPNQFASNRWWKISLHHDSRFRSITHSGTDSAPSLPSPNAGHSMRIPCLLPDDFLVAASSVAGARPGPADTERSVAVTPVSTVAGADRHVRRCRAVAWGRGRSIPGIHDRRS